MRAGECIFRLIFGLRFAHKKGRVRTDDKIYEMYKHLAKVAAHLLLHTQSESGERERES